MKCKCTLSKSLVGDGCEICNPRLALEYARENIQELEQQRDKLMEVAKAFVGMLSSPPCIEYDTTKHVYKMQYSENIAASFDALRNVIAEIEAAK